MTRIPRPSPLTQLCPMDFTSLPKGVASARPSKAIYPGTGLLFFLCLGLPSCTCHLLYCGDQSIRATSLLSSAHSCAMPRLYRHLLLRRAATLLHHLLCLDRGISDLFRSSSHILISPILHNYSSPGPYGLKQPLSVRMIESEASSCSLDSLCSVDRHILLYNLGFVNRIVRQLD